MYIANLVAGQLPVLWVAEHIEVDVALARVRVISFDQAFH